MPKPLKRFGQNYLVDKNILNKIVGTINPNEEDAIVEIGPGTGALTKPLSEKCKNLIAVEIDSRVADNLEEEFPGVELIKGNFLEVNLEEIFLKKKNKLRVVGNIPYNLTSSRTFKLINKNDIIYDSVLMVQYEVAKRMIAKQGTKDYGILTVLLNYFTKTELCFRISPNVFFPKPKVYSALVKISFRQINETEDFHKLFIKVVKAAFSTRRKTLKNSLGGSIFSDVDFSNCEIDLSRRAETLNSDEFLQLTNHINSRSNG